MYIGIYVYIYMSIIYVYTCISMYIYIYCISAPGMIRMAWLWDRIFSLLHFLSTRTTVCKARRVAAVPFTTGPGGDGVPAKSPWPGMYFPRPGPWFLHSLGKILPPEWSDPDVNLETFMTWCAGVAAYHGSLTTDFGSCYSSQKWSKNVKMFTLAFLIYPTMYPTGGFVFSTASHGPSVDDPEGG